MKNSESFKQFILDQLAGLEVVARSMFGGVGLYSEQYFFGIIASDVLYLRVDETNRREYERARMKPFKPYKDRPSTMKYYAVPASVLECAPDLEKWARSAISVAKRAKT